MRLRATGSGFPNRPPALARMGPPGRLGGHAKLHPSVGDFADVQVLSAGESERRSVRRVDDRIASFLVIVRELKADAFVQQTRIESSLHLLADLRLQIVIAEILG